MMKDPNEIYNWFCMFGSWGGGGGGGKSHGPLYFKLFLLHVTFTYYYNKN